MFFSVGVEGNPYTTPDETGMVTRKDPSLRRTVSVRGQLFYSKPHHRVSAGQFKACCILEMDKLSTNLKLLNYICTSSKVGICLSMQF